MSRQEVPAAPPTPRGPGTERSSPEEPLPGGEVGALEERVLQDALHSSQGLDHVRAVVVQVPKLPVVALVGPPEGVLLQHLGEQRGQREGGLGGAAELAALGAS